MAYHCPACQEARVAYVGTTDDARTELRCELCGHEWLHGGAARDVAIGRQLPQTIQQARARFPTADSVSEQTSRRVEDLKAQFLTERPEPLPEVARFWARYQHVFSEAGLETAEPAELKYFANTDVGAHPGNMSVFNRAWNELGDQQAADRVRSVVQHLLRGPQEVPLEDRLTRLIDPEDPLGMTGFRESLLTKVLCVVQPDRFLPILIYTSPAGGKREIGRDVFDLELPAPAASGWTRGRLACWSNDLLVQLVGDGFVDLQHASQFLWWAKSQPRS